MGSQQRCVGREIWLKNPTFTSRWSLAPDLGGSLHLLGSWSNGPAYTHLAPLVLCSGPTSPQDDKILRAQAFISLTHYDIKPDPLRDYINIK